MFLSTLNKKQSSHFIPTLSIVGRASECLDKDEESKDDTMFDDVVVAKTQNNVDGVLQTRIHVENLDSRVSSVGPTIDPTALVGGTSR
jgi:hypothetical protein